MAASIDHVLHERGSDIGRLAALSDGVLSALSYFYRRTLSEHCFSGILFALPVDQQCI